RFVAPGFQVEITPSSVLLMIASHEELTIAASNDGASPGMSTTVCDSRSHRSVSVLFKKPISRYRKLMIRRRYLVLHNRRCFVRHCGQRLNSPAQVAIPAKLVYLLPIETASRTSEPHGERLREGGLSLALSLRTARTFRKWSTKSM